MTTITFQNKRALLHKRNIALCWYRQGKVSQIKALTSTTTLILNNFFFNLSSRIIVYLYIVFNNIAQYNVTPISCNNLASVQVVFF